jgi:cytochrome c peroxidase
MVLPTQGLPTGLVVGPDGPVVVTRQPFAVLDARGALVPAEGEREPGFALFHAPSPAGVACATCHAEGREDGHTWDFVGLGLRRTQSLAGGVTATAPFHWDGSLADLSALFDDTGVLRMGMARPTADELDALGAWLDGLPAPVPARDADPDGEQVFATAGCWHCHDPVSRANEDVGTGGAFQAPSLAGVSARLPLMHDGCAATIRDRFDPACGGDAHGPALAPDEIDALVRYLESR